MEAFPSLASLPIKLSVAPKGVKRVRIMLLEVLDACDWEDFTLRCGESNGRCTLMWYDNWSGMGPRINYITYRNLYNAGMDRNCSVSDMIDNGSWKWPRDWYDLFPFLSNITVPNLIQGKEDSNVWLDNGERLLTQDRLKRWGCYDMMVCSLCLKNEESHNHMFYQCDYIKEIWNQLTLMMEGSMIGTEWKKIVDSFAAMDSKRSIGNIIRKLMIYDSVRTKMMGLEVKRSDVVCLAAAKWNVNRAVNELNVIEADGFGLGNRVSPTLGLGYDQPILSAIYPNKVVSKPGYNKQWQNTVRLSLAKNVAYNVVNEKTTYGLIKALSNMYERPSASNKVFRIRQLMNTKMMKGASVADHVNEFNLILSRLMLVDIKFDDEVQALLLLSSLPESWSCTVTTVNGSTGTTKLKFDNIRDLIIGEDIRRVLELFVKYIRQRQGHKARQRAEAEQR
ncbi:retrovirus-related pol polyprotein from transposon TNT 1-94 [Tanacetum coccineum]